MLPENIVPRTFDNETCQVVAIALSFLQKYFGHSEDESEALTRKFFALHAQRFDEDVIHHESSYRIAAAIHYISYLNGDPSKLGDWMIENRHNQSPPEALEIFRERYFSR